MPDGNVLPIDINAPIDVPMMPPKSWFYDIPADFDPRDGLIQVKLDGPDEGRVVALVAPEGEQILADFEWQTPQSPTNYEFAHVGTTITAEGDKVRTANVGGNINHAPPAYAMRAAVDLYANTATRTLRGRYHDVPGVGVVFTGAMWPGLTKRDALTTMGMAISGDWRYVASLGERDLAGSQLVNAPALRPLPHGHKRADNYRPALFVPVAASFGGGVVFGDWVADDEADNDVAVFASRLRRLEQVVGELIANEVDDISPDGHDDEYDDIFKQAYGCRACGATGCDHCNDGIAKYDPFDEWGYELDDDPETGDEHDGGGHGKCAKCAAGHHMCGCNKHARRSAIDALFLLTPGSQQL